MHDPWIESKSSFINWILENLGHKPDRKISLDRINNELGYVPLQGDSKIQLRWATPKQQALNKSFDPHHLDGWTWTDECGWQQSGNLLLPKGANSNQL